MDPTGEGGVVWLAVSSTAQRGSGRLVRRMFFLIQETPCDVVGGLAKVLFWERAN